MAQQPPSTGEPSIPELEPSLRRFAEALSVVVDSLAQFGEKAVAPSESGADAGLDGVTQESIPRADELAELLAHNDTRAETVIAEIRAAWQGAEPSWLAAAARAIDELDYPAALKHLRAAGAVRP